MNVSLYVHIPFCQQKCDYCDFFSVPVCSEINQSVFVRYISAVVKEAEYYVKKYKIKKWNTIYIGGGTPSLLGGHNISFLINKLLDLVNKNIPEEISVEVNPESVTEELIDSFNQCFVTRISMGIQALDDKVLKLINRKCTVEKIYSSLNLLKRKWNKNLSIDFIAGLPEHSYKSFENQFNILKDYYISHVSLYTLTVEENTPLYKKICDNQILWNPDKADRMWEKGRHILESMDYKQYEISNFALEGFESIHNQTYWKLQDYIGIGSGATGTVYGDNTIRWTNTLNLKKYVDFWSDSCNKTDLSENNVEKIRHVEKIDKETQLFEFLMMGFRMLKGISSDEFYRRFNKRIESIIGSQDGLYSKWTERGLTNTYAKDNDVFYALNKKGIMLLNQFLESLL